MAPAELRVGGLVPLTTIDYPGELSAVIFCQGCSWRCSYCHNPELLPVRSSGAIPWRDVVEFLMKRRGLLDAVVFSGGEPTLQASLSAAVDEVRALGFKIGIHSAGAYPGRLQALLPKLDWVGLDVKALPGTYAALTGAPGSGIKAWYSAELVIRSGVSHQLRITADPSWMSVDEVAAIKQRLIRMGAENVVVQSVRSADVSTYPRAAVRLDPAEAPAGPPAGD